MRSTFAVLGMLILAHASADAGVFSGLAAKQEPSLFSRKNRPRPEEVPGGRPPNLIAPNGVEVPAWASKRMRESPTPLAGKSWGRRPWALPLSNQATPSATWARASQLGFGAGPVTGYTNDYGGAGNYPMAHVGKEVTNGWVAGQGLRGLFQPAGSPFAPLGTVPGAYPWITGATGY